MKRDFTGQLNKIVSFLEYDLSPAVLDKIEQATSFSRMKTDQFSNHQEITQLEGFFRKGEIGSWKDQFSVSQSDAFDQLYQTRMQGSGLDFDFE